jgi:superfamily II DNA or RNA helicase
MRFTLSDIRDIFGGTVYGRGLEYAQSDRVLTLRGDGEAIEASVKGSGRNIYTQEIDVLGGSDHLDIEGHCSCPVGYNCKHVAAALIEYCRTHQRHFPVSQTPFLDRGRMPQEATRQLPPAAPSLPPALTAWLQRLESMVTAARPATGIDTAVKTKAATTYRLIFVLSPAYGGKHVNLSICKARFRVTGEIASADQVRDLQRLLTHSVSYMLPEDEDLIRFFGAMQGSVYYCEPSTEPKGKLGAQLLRSLLDQQKLWWANSLSDLAKGILNPLMPAPARCAGLAWREENGKLHLALQFRQGLDAEAENWTENQGEKSDRMIDHVLPTDPPWYVDNLSCGELRLLRDGAPGGAPVPTQNLLALVAQTPALDAENAIVVTQQLLTRGLAQIIPLPAKLQEVTLHDVPAEITLLLGSVAARPVDGSLMQAHGRDYASLMFSYDGAQVAVGGNAASVPTIVRQSRAGLERIVRDLDGERRALEQLHALGFLPPGENMPALQSIPNALVLPNPTAWLNFAREELPNLEQQGWRVRKIDSYRFDVIEVEDWYAEVDEDKGAGNAWFDLELGIVVNQVRISLLPVLVELIRNAPHEFNPLVLAQHADSDQILATLPGGVHVALPWGRIKPILATLGELYFSERTGASVRLSTLDAARLEELANGTQLRWMGGERLRSIGRKLSEFGGVQQVEPPQGLQATLRDYQKEGLAWLQFLREYDLAGILADDMGLGKTIQTLAHILVEKEAGRLTHPVLVVAPTSLMSNWQQEAARFAPALRVLVLHGADRAAHFDEIDRFDLVLTTYALLSRDEDRLRQHTYYLVVLDEAHYIKNARSKAAQTAGLLTARHRLCLTGTPLENHLGELWSQFHFLLPGLLGDEKHFNADFRNPIEKQGNDLRRTLLIRRIKPFLLRRTKDKVAKELPPKTEMVRTVDLHGAQRDLYETVRLAMDQKVRDEIEKKGIARSQIVILEALLKLRQVCCDPRLVKTASARRVGIPSAKLDELMEMLEELLDEGRKILVFSQFTSMLALIEEELQARSIPYALLTGDTRDRPAAVQSFQQGEASVFLISLKAGGVGLNLTAADTVIHYDPWWNPAAETQAADRAWRIGQDKPVFVYKLIARGTLEEKIQLLQQKKAELARAMLSDGVAQNVKITQDDLQAIFAPLEDQLQYAE